MTTGKRILPHSNTMLAARSPRLRFLRHSLWVVLPFLALMGLAWSAWRADASTRRSRLLEAAEGFSENALKAIATNLGPWTSIPKTDRTRLPPLPDQDLAAMEARKRYDAGDFEGVLGSPESLRSAAGLPLRSLAAIRLMRTETDPARLIELSQVFTGSMDFFAPPFLEEAEKRFQQLEIPLPPALGDWRNRWQRAEAEASLAEGMDEKNPATWKHHQGIDYLIEVQSESGQWRVTTANGVLAIATPIHQGAKSNLVEGLNLHLQVAGRSVAGAPGLISFARKELSGWQSDVVLADEAAYLRGDRKARNFMTAVIAIAALALITGLVLGGRAYVRAVELAHQQSEFMAAISHEMRTPIAAVGLLAENLASGVADRCGQREDHTKLIREECSRLGSLVDNVLAFTRRQKPEHLGAFDVAAMIEDLSALLQPIAQRKEIELELCISPFPSPPHGDVPALRRAVLNLLDNAVKHTPSGGKVVCRAFPDVDQNWKLEISDTGPGIPLVERKRIFEAFYRIGDELRRSTPGTGLGLALVKCTVEAHGGSIEVKDAPGGGACFVFTLPLQPTLK